VNGPGVARVKTALVLVVVLGAGVLWWRTERARPLTLSLGDRFADIRRRFGAELHEVEGADSSWTMIARRHQLTLELPGGPYTLPVSRYAALDFNDHRLEHILTNPHPEALSFDEARALHLDLCERFTALGWEVHRAPFPDAEWVEGWRRKDGSRPVLPLAYFRKDGVIVAQALKLLSWRGDPVGPGVRVPPGLGFVTGLFGWGEEAADRWLFDLEVLATDLARKDHGMVLGFERFRARAGPPR
jgi:hypothetical protein